MKEGGEFEWDAANIEHIARHGVTPEEAEQVLANDPVLLSGASRGTEFRTVRLGKTNAGRYLTVVYTIKGGKIRVVTAYPMKRRYRKLYETRKGKA